MRALCPSPLLLPTVLPPFPLGRGRPPLLLAVSLSFFSFSLLSLSFVLSFSFLDVALFCCCRSCYVMCGYWLLISAQHVLF